MRKKGGLDMKILLATYWTVPHLGGVWSYMKQLQKELKFLGHEVDMLAYGGENTYVQLINKGLKIEKEKVFPLVSSNLKEGTYQDLYENVLINYTEFQMYIYELAALYFGLDEYDIIHTQDVISSVCMKRVKPEGTPLVCTLHGCVAHEIRDQINNIHKSSTSHMARAYFDALEPLGAKAGEYTIVANNWLKNVLINEFQVEDKQIKVSHYGYDIDAFLNRVNTKTNIQIPSDKKIILYSGRLIRLKGVHDLISALAQLKETRDDWVCWIVGDGEDQETLQKQVENLGLDEDVFFFGKQDNIPYLVSKSDICVLPSLIENQPLSIIEAQISGKPVIVSEVGGLPEMVENGVTGLTFPVGDIEALYERIEILLDDDEYRKELGAKAKTWGIDHWSLYKGVKATIGIYKSAISKKLNSEESFLES